MLKLIPPYLRDMGVVAREVLLARLGDELGR